MSELARFIRGCKRSRDREHLLTARLIHEAGIAAAATGGRLMFYTPTVDSDGFDVIFDDTFRLIPLQLKSIHAKGRTRAWKVHRSLLRPQPGHNSLYGFGPDQERAGRGGGVVLTKVAVEDNDVSVTYSYTDIAVLMLKWKGIIPVSEAQKLRLAQLQRDLKSGPDAKVEVPRSAFWNCSTPDMLLALAGLKSTVKTRWRERLIDLLEAEDRQLQTTFPEEHDPEDSPEDYRRALTEEVEQLLTVR